MKKILLLIMMAASAISVSARQQVNGQQSPVMAPNEV